MLTSRSCDNLGEALIRYHDFHRLIYDGSPLVVELQGRYGSIRWEATELHPTQLTDEIAIALVIQFLRLFMSHEDVHLHEVRFLNAAPKILESTNNTFNVPFVLANHVQSYSFQLRKFISPSAVPTIPYSSY